MYLSVLCAVISIMRLREVTVLPSHSFHVNSFMLSKRRLSLILSVLSCARSVYTFVVFEMFFEALNLRSYTLYS